MSRISIEIETQQSFVYSHEFTCNQLIRLRELLIHKGQRRIDNKFFDVSDTALTLYKSSKFGGPGYAMDRNKTLNEVNAKLTKFC